MGVIAAAESFTVLQSCDCVTPEKCMKCDYKCVLETNQLQSAFSVPKMKSDEVPDSMVFSLTGLKVVSYITEWKNCC